jgi:phage-related protein
MGFFDSFKNIVGKIGGGISKAVNFGKNIVGKVSGVRNFIHDLAGKVTKIPIIGDTLKTLYDSTPVGNMVKTFDSRVGDLLQKAGGGLDMIDNRVVNTLDKVSQGIGTAEKLTNEARNVGKKVYSGFRNVVRPNG